MMRFAPVFIVLATFSSLPIAQADDVTDQIQEALTAYEKKDLNTAAIALDAASKLIRQQQAEKIANLLPAPLDGWRVRDRGRRSGGGAIFGGGVQAKREYQRARERVTVTLASNSPMLQAMTMMMTNPAFQSGGMKLVIMGGRKVMQNERDNSLQTIVANKMLVNVKGNRSAEPAAVKDYFKAIDFDALEKEAR